jgi:hypothetical protein
MGISKIVNVNFIIIFCQQNLTVVIYIVLMTVYYSAVDKVYYVYVCVHMHVLLGHHMNTWQLGSVLC